MRRYLQRVTLLALTIMVLCVPGFAESVSFDGTVTAAYTHEVYADSSGMIEHIPIVIGQTVSASDMIAVLRTNNVYGDEDGMISAVSGPVRDLTETITERNKAVISKEGPVSETIEEYQDAERIGRGNIARNAPISVTDSSRIASLLMTSDIVKRGDLLKETLEGSGDSNIITADVDGIVAALNVTQGTPVEEDSVIAVLWPNDAMQIEMAINEGDLSLISVGDEVDLIFEWNADSSEKLTGTVTFISAVSDEASGDTQYVAYISFTPNDSVRYGMTAKVYISDDE